MNRRQFCKASASILLAGSARKGWPADPKGRPEDAVDLLERIRLGQNALLGGLDPTRGHLPYWFCAFAGGDLVGFRHSPEQGYGVWDQMHDVGRALHGLSLAESVTGRRVSPPIVRDLSGHLLELFRAGDGLPGFTSPASGKRIVNLHNIRETLNGLTALIKWGNSQALGPARRMVLTLRQALDSSGKIHLERLPPYVGGYRDQPSGEGRSVDALVRYYRVSRDEVALETAGLITRYALSHCFAETGALTPAAGSHGHSINALVAGMIDFGLETSDSKLVDRIRRVYDVGLPRFNSSFGWSMEALNKFRFRGEANNTGDLVRASLLLGKAGFPGYFGRAERILRSHLLPSQAVEVGAYSDRADSADDSVRLLASRVRGGFSFPTPNDLQFTPDAPLFTYDITSGAVDALCQAHRAQIESGPDGTRLHLLFGRDAPECRIVSRLSSEGSIRLEIPPSRNFRLRLPNWVRPEEIAVEPAAARGPIESSYLLLRAAEAKRTVAVRFPIRKERTTESILSQPFTIDWAGDQIIAMSPPSPPRPDGAPIPRRNSPMFPLCA